MFTLISAVAILAAGFGLGRVKHPSNLKLTAIKAEIVKIEGEVSTDVKSVIARVKAIL